MSSKEINRRGETALCRRRCRTYAGIAPTGEGSRKRENGEHIEDGRSDIRRLQRKTNALKPVRRLRSSPGCANGGLRASRGEDVRKKFAARFSVSRICRRRARQSSCFARCTADVERRCQCAPGCRQLRTVSELRYTSEHFSEERGMP